MDDPRINTLKFADFTQACNNDQKTNSFLSIDLKPNQTNTHQSICLIYLDYYEWLLLQLQQHLPPVQTITTVDELLNYNNNKSSVNIASSSSFINNTVYDIRLDNTAMRTTNSTTNSNATHSNHKNSINNSSTSSIPSTNKTSMLISDIPLKVAKSKKKRAILSTLHTTTSTDTANTASDTSPVLSTEYSSKLIQPPATTVHTSHNNDQTISLVSATVTADAAVTHHHTSINRMVVILIHAVSHHYISIEKFIYLLTLCCTHINNTSYTTSSSKNQHHLASHTTSSYTTSSVYNDNLIILTTPSHILHFSTILLTRSHPFLCSLGYVFNRVYAVPVSVCDKASGVSMLNMADEVECMYNINEVRYMLTLYFI